MQIKLHHRYYFLAPPDTLCEVVNVVDQLYRKIGLKGLKNFLNTGVSIKLRRDMSIKVSVGKTLCRVLSTLRLKVLSVDRYYEGFVVDESFTIFNLHDCKSSGISV